MSRIPFAILAVTAVLILAFQNFSHVSQDRLRSLNRESKKHDGYLPSPNPFQPNHTRLHIDRIVETTPIERTSNQDTPEPRIEFDIRDLARKFQGSLGDPLTSPLTSNSGPIAAHAATPKQSEPRQSDLTQTGQTLLERELRPTLEPIEKEWMGRVNRYLSGFVPVDGEDWPEAGGEQDSGEYGRDPAGQQGFPSLPPSLPGGLPEQPAEGAEQPASGVFSWKTYRVRDIRLTKANEISLGFSHQTRLSCELDSGGSRLRLSRPLSQTSSIDFRHETQDSRNSLGLNISW